MNDTGVFQVNNKYIEDFKDLCTELHMPAVLVRRAFRHGIDLNVLWKYSRSMLNDKKTKQLDKLLKVKFKVVLQDEDGVSRTFFTLHDVAEFVGINDATLSNRIQRGWSLEDAFNTPTGAYTSYRRCCNKDSPRVNIPFEVDGVKYTSIKDFSKRHGFNYNIISYNELQSRNKEDREAWIKHKLQARSSLGEVILNEYNC